MEVGRVMLDSDLGLSDGLLKQRRNLLVTSLLLLFLQQSGATIEGLSVAGTSLKFSNPKAIYQGLWLLFFYFNLRYFQHYLDEGHIKFNSVWDSKFSKNARERAEVYVKKKVVESGITGEIDGLPDHALRQIPGFKWQVDRGYIKWRDTAGGNDFFKHDINIPFRILWRSVIKTSYQIIMLGSSFTNYAIPFLLSAIAFASCGFSEWSGSLLKLLFN